LNISPKMLAKFVNEFNRKGHTMILPLAWMFQNGKLQALFELGVR